MDIIWCKINDVFRTDQKNARKLFLAEKKIKCRQIILPQSLTVLFFFFKYSPSKNLNKYEHTMNLNIYVSNKCLIL